MRRLAWLFVLPLAFCQYQPQQQQQQRYNQPNHPNQQYGNQQQQFGQQLNNPQQQQQYGQRGQQNPANQQWVQNQNQQQQGYQQGYQQGTYNGQTGTGNNQNNQQIGRSEIVNTPTRLLTGNAATDPSSMGALIDFRLTSYQNGDLSLSNVTTCSCPNGKYCDYLPSTGQNDCMFSFTSVISAKDQSVQFIQSDFYPFSGSISNGNWTNSMQFQFPSKPVAIDVFVQHLGVVIHKTTGSLLFFNHLTLVDSFVVDMSEYIPTQNQNPRSYTLTGALLRTQLNLVLSVQCINSRMGENCDLSCDASLHPNSNNVICVDNQGRNTSCQWASSYKNQVQNCIVCNTVGANGTCAQVLLDRGDSGLVSYAFRTWTIVLGCLLGLALLFILCLIISFIILRNRADPDETPSTAYKQESSYANGKSSSRPLLEDEWAAAPRRPLMPERTDDYGNRGHTRDTTTSVSRQEHQV